MRNWTSHHFVYASAINRAISVIVKSYNSYGCTVYYVYWNTSRRAMHVCKICLKFKKSLF